MEHALNEANKNFKQRLIEGSQISLQWNPNAQEHHHHQHHHNFGPGYGQRQQHQPQPDGFFHPLDCEPTLLI
ncbi:Agamous-like MADS-box protein AGL9 [Castilleja foliolosa]|uniref:Agamous-like MADS-box protein AGL9 n=1 Tax=Castilleja foliolosa TaxID=1961234 RepID=A0ABD3CDB0_9LAMI